MIIQIILLLLLCGLAMYLSEEKTVLLVLMLLPFHFLVKSALFPIIDEGQLFGLWKELMLSVVALKIGYRLFKKEIQLNSYFPYWTILVLLAGLGFLFIKAPVKNDALISLKSFAFPFLILFVFSNIPFRFLGQKKVYLGIGLSAICVFFIAHVEQFFLTKEFGHLYRIINTIMPNGKIIYTESAYTIMARNRMYGPMVGPNELGMYCSLILVLFSYIFFTGKFNTKGKIFFLAILILGISSLIQTYSRASWAMFLMASFFVFVVGVKKWKPILYFGLYVILSVGTMVAVNKDLQVIFMGSVTGQEASASARTATFEQSSAKIYSKPLGYGLGTIQYSSKNIRGFKTEIFWWLVVGEVGILFGIVMLVLYFTGIIKIVQFGRRRLSSNAFTEVMPSFLFAVVCAGWASVIIFDPTFQEYLWSFCGMAINPNLFKADYE